jgi:DNA-binding response OmpR family regulator
MSAHIVIVEDDRDLGSIIYHRLRKAGYQCLLIADSTKAFPLIKHKKPDLVILDIMMPQVSGFDLCRQIRRDPLVFMTPVLMVSALDGDPEVKHALHQGADDYLVKPFDSGTLFAKVKSVLEKQARIMKKSSLTGFHGVDYIKRVITNRLFRNEVVAACYVTLTHFAPYAKAYSSEKRDEAVGLLATILVEVARDSGVFEFSIAHLGGADFLALLSVKDCERYADEVVLRFRNRRTSLSNGVDLDRGMIEINADGGGIASYPLMSAAVGAVTNESICFQDSTQMVKVAGEVNKRAQQQQGNGHLEILREAILL